MTNLLPKDSVNRCSNDIKKKNEIDLFNPLSNNKKRTETLSKKDVQTVKQTSIAAELHGNGYDGNDRYQYFVPSPFVMADRLDLLILGEILKNPSITSLEISLRLEIPFSIAHKKRRLIESKVLQRKYSLDFKKLGFNIHFADVFVNIKKDKVNDFINYYLKSSSVTKNIFKIVKIITPSNGICIKTLYQNSDELLVLVDKIKSYPFVSNVRFSEETEVLKDSTVDIILNLLDSYYK